MMVRVAAVALAGALLAGCGSGAEHREATIRTVTDFYGFVADNSNIGCVMDATAARCDVQKHTWKAPKDTEKCQLDYGDGIWIDARQKPKFVCAGDTALHAGAEVPSGHGIRAGKLQCEVWGTTVTCTDHDGGHGFELSAAKYRLF